MSFRKGPVGEDVARALDAASARNASWGGASLSERVARDPKSVDAVCARIERRALVRSFETAARAEALAPVRAAKEAIVSARMTDAGASPYAVARAGAKPAVVETNALLVGADGAERLEVSEATALFSPAACAVMRLAAKGAIDAPSLKAALAFAWSGDVVMGAVRVRTVDWDRVSGVADGYEGERVAHAVELWRTALGELTRFEFDVLDGVMRHDLSSGAAAKRVWPREKGDNKLAGMGDAMLITASDKLSFEYGFRSRNEVVSR